MIFKIFSPKIFATKLAFLTQNKAKYWKKLITTLVFRRKLGKIAENCDHNIDPWFCLRIIKTLTCRKTKIKYFTY
jgi:hypothetical protein